MPLYIQNKNTPCLDYLLKINIVYPVVSMQELSESDPMKIEELDIFPISEKELKKLLMDYINKQTKEHHQKNKQEKHQLK